MEDRVGVYSRNRELKWVRSKMLFWLGSKTLLAWCQLLCSSPHLQSRCILVMLYLSQSLRGELYQCGEIYMIHIMQPHEFKRSFTQCWPILGETNWNLTICVRKVLPHIFADNLIIIFNWLVIFQPIFLRLYLVNFTVLFHFSSFSVQSLLLKTKLFKQGGTVRNIHVFV